MFRNLPPVCRSLILALVAAAVMSLISSDFVMTMIPLYSEGVTHHFQLWRLVTFPFFFLISGRSLISGIINLAWIGMMIAFFGGELETIVHSKRVGIALAATILGCGSLFILISPQGTLAGPSIITMFFLGGFAYMWPKREISIFGLFWIKAWIIALAIFVVSIIPMSGFNLDTSATNIFGPIFGALGAILYLHITYRQYRFGKSMLDKVDSITHPRRKPVSTIGDDLSVERRIDAILDKIGKSGMQSLSKEEREFLLNHSK